MSGARATARPLVGVLVGGAGRRMGGAAKGLLVAPTGESIVARWRALCAATGLDCVLVGNAQAYADLGMPAIADAAAGAGPLGGVVALMRVRPTEPVIAVACDMPRVTAPLLARLAAAAPDAPATAPRRADRWEPLFARYDSARVLAIAERHLAAGKLSLQELLTVAGAQPLALDDGEWALLEDWDEPGDRR